MLLEWAYIDLKTIWKAENTQNSYYYLRKDQKRRQEEISIKLPGKLECLSPEYKGKKQFRIEYNRIDCINAEMGIKENKSNLPRKTATEKKMD